MDQKQTLRAILSASETIVVLASTGAAGGVEIPLVSSKDAIGRHVKTTRNRAKALIATLELEGLE
jgi:hypothetical protein